MQFSWILRSIAGVVSGTAVAFCNIEKPVSSKLDHSSVVVRERLRDGQQYSLRVRVGDVRVAGDMELANDRGAVAGTRVVYKESLIGPELGMERQAQDSLFAAAGDF